MTEIQSLLYGIVNNPSHAFFHRLLTNFPFFHNIFQGTRTELENTGPFDFTLETEDIVQVFRWSTSGSWRQLGRDILTTGNFFTDFGSALSLSKDSTRLAISSPDEDSELLGGGAVRVYEWDEENDDWVQIGSTLFGWEENLQFGYSVSLSGNGMTLTVGTSPVSKKDSQMRFYAWNEVERNWDLVDALAVGTGSVGKIAADASLLAVSSMIDSRDDVLETNLYQYLSPPKACDEGESLMKFSLLTDERGSDIEWRIESSNSTILLEREEVYYNDRITSAIHEICIPKDECTTLKIVSRLMKKIQSLLLRLCSHSPAV